ncbi:NUDIX hydrolase [Heyndrickxia sp. NPDC080065]|uniref:NUDIX hydrolase n=1 Tax=Heyndrickxia sp. NPDC080065 TaxID=3390568 RepID=UPI003D037763
MRNRGSSILIENSRVCLIKRSRDGQVYYVIPGGGIDKGETPELAAKREAYEELGVKIIVKEIFGKVEYKGTQFFFLADIVEGEIGIGTGEEFTDANRNRGTYEPMWVDIDKLSLIDVRPKEVAEKIQSIFN